MATDFSLIKMKIETEETFIRRHGLLILGLIFFVLSLSIHKRLITPAINITKQESAYNINITFLKMISGGNQKIISSVLWIKTLLESDHEKYVKSRYADWMYVRFLAIANLDPWFYENYLFGGMYLSVIKDDLEGATHIFEMGLQKYPDDYKLIYYNGFNYFFERGDYQKGFEQLKKIEDHPKTPSSLKFVINKLRFETSGNYEVALNFLSEALKLAKDESIKKKITKDIYSIVAERDLDCLNKGQENCNLKDAFGGPYFRDPNGKWKSEIDFIPFQIFRPER